MRFRKISSQKFDPTGEFFHDSAIQMQAFIAFAAQKFGINENTSYLCNVNQFDLLSGKFPRGSKTLSTLLQFVKPYIKCAALVLSKTIHHHFQSPFLKKNSPYIAEIMNSLE